MHQFVFEQEYGKGITLFVGATGSLLCPVAAVLAYLACRPNTPGPLFLLSSGVPLTREAFVSRLKQGLSSAGIDSSGYNGHSFRIGAAARVGIPERFLAGGNHLHTAYTSELLDNSLQAYHRT